MKVAQWVKTHPGAAVTVRWDMPLGDVVDVLLAESCLRDLYVVDEDGRLMGHLSYKRLAEHLLAEHRPVHTRRQLMERIAGGDAGDFMDTHFASASADEELEDVLQRQLEKEIQDMPVMDMDGTLLGLINLTEVLREFRRVEKEIVKGNCSPSD